MNTWTQDNVPYPANAIVEHQGKVYEKLDDNDQSPPDEIGKAWRRIDNDPHCNVAQYEAIETSFNSYEQRVKDHKAAVLAKLKAAGLDPADVKAVVDAP